MSVEKERELLRQAQGKGSLATLAAYLRLSGPGWLQSAITLGGGSLASSLYLGILAGFSMLWLQPLAMALGIIMLSAIGYVTLSTGERPFRAINEHVNPVLGWAWALASLAANMVWCLPQYSLATGVLQQNLAPTLLGAESALGDFQGKLLIVAAILVVTTLVTWAYDSGSWGIRMYEWVLKAMVAMIVLCFIGVVIRVAAGGRLDWGAIFAGFVPDFSLWYQPSPGFRALLDAVPENARDYWHARIISEQRNVMISAAATAVGINMTFLLPYTLLKRGWTKEFRGLLRFDLATGMLIPFVLATSCVIVASANQFHPGLTDEAAARAFAAKLDDPAKQSGAEKSAILTAKKAKLPDDVLDRWQAMTRQEQDEAIGSVALDRSEGKLALALVRRDALQLANSLEPLTGRLFADVIFGLGVLGMTLSTITLLMLISGLVVCEMLNLPTAGWPYRLGCLAAATGVLGPFLWSKIPRFYLAIPASVFGMTLLPFAYLSFFFLMNQRSLLGAEMPRGVRRLCWNGLMAIAAGVATVASLWVINANAGAYGLGAVIALVVLALVVQFRRWLGRSTRRD